MGFTPKLIALIFLASFVTILLYNTIHETSSVLQVSYFPQTVKEGNPVAFLVTVYNPSSETKTYTLNFYADDKLLASNTIKLEPNSYQTYTYTREAPKAGSSMRISAVLLEQNKVIQTKTITIPYITPETMISFVSLSSFSFSYSFSSSSSSSMSFTISYYLSMMKLSSKGYVIEALSIGLVVALVLIGLLMFHELTNPHYNRLSIKLQILRKNYAILIISLLAIFFSLVFTIIAMIIAGG